MDEISTKKFPVSIEGKGEFIIPVLSNPPESGFIGLKTGRSYKSGAISYIGKAIAVEDVLARLKTTPENKNHAIRILNSFLTQLQSFKVGNVVSVRYDSEGMPLLIMQSKRPPTEDNRRLP